MTYRDFPSASAVSAMYVRLIGEQMRHLAELKHADLQSFWGIKKSDCHSKCQVEGRDGDIESIIV